MRQLLLLIFLSSVIAIQTSARTRLAIASAGNGWLTSTNWLPAGLPVDGDTVIIPADFILSIKGNVYSAGNKPTLVIFIYGTLDFEPSGKLDLGNNSEIYIYTGGRISSNNTNSEQISIAGIMKFNGQQDGIITGPAFASINTNSTPNGFSSYFLLPLKLLSFSYQVWGNQIAFKWELLKDKEEGIVTIEKADEKGNWVAIHTDKFTGNINQKISGYYNTEFINGKVYFRLRINENNGVVSFSNILNINGSREKDRISLYPNPAKEFVCFNLANPDKPTIIQIWNQQGKIINQLRTQHKNLIKIPLHSFSNGLYTISIRNEIESTIEKLVVRN
jgi:hypothetical protein